MGKKAKGNRLIIYLECTECKARNYSTTLNRVNQKEQKLELKKYCRTCRKHTAHKTIKL